MYLLGKCASPSKGCECPSILTHEQPARSQWRGRTGLSPVSLLAPQITLKTVATSRHRVNETATSQRIPVVRADRSPGPPAARIFVHSPATGTRPGFGEMRPASGEEWQEFEEHFLLRKVALGDCHRQPDAVSQDR